MRRLDPRRSLQEDGGGLGVHVEMTGEAVETVEEAGGVEEVTFHEVGTATSE